MEIAMVIKPMDFIFSEHESRCNAVYRRITPSILPNQFKVSITFCFQETSYATFLLLPFVKETSVLVKVIKIVQVRG